GAGDGGGFSDFVAGGEPAESAGFLSGTRIEFDRGGRGNSGFGGAVAAPELAGNRGSGRGPVAGRSGSFDAGFVCAGDDTGAGGIRVFGGNSGIAGRRIADECRRDGRLDV